MKEDIGQIYIAWYDEKPVSSPSEAGYALGLDGRVESEKYEELWDKLQEASLIKQKEEILSPQKEDSNIEVIVSLLKNIGWSQSKIDDYLENHFEEIYNDPDLNKQLDVMIQLNRIPKKSGRYRYIAKKSNAEWNKWTDEFFTIYAGNIQGLYKINSTGSFSRVEDENNGLVNANVLSLCYDPISNSLFAGMDGKKGIYKTQDEKVWETTNLFTKTQNQNRKIVRALVTQNNFVYAIINKYQPSPDGLVVYFSEIIRGNGDNWSSDIFTSSTRILYCVAASKKNKNTLLVGGQGGLWVSTDLDQLNPTWTKILDLPYQQKSHDVYDIIRENSSGPFEVFWLATSYGVKRIIFYPDKINTGSSIFVNSFEESESFLKVTQLNAKTFLAITKTQLFRIDLNVNPQNLLLLSSSSVLCKTVTNTQLTDIKVFKNKIYLSQRNGFVEVSQDLETWKPLGNSYDVQVLYTTDDKIYAGYFKGGVAKYSGDQSFQPFNTGLPLDVTCLMTLNCDNEQTVVVGTDNSILIKKQSDEYWSAFKELKEVQSMVIAKINSLFYINSKIVALVSVSTGQDFDTLSKKFLIIDQALTSYSLENPLPSLDPLLPVKSLGQSQLIYITQNDDNYKALSYTILTKQTAVLAEWSKKNTKVVRDFDYNYKNNTLYLATDSGLYLFKDKNLTRAKIDQLFRCSMVKIDNVETNKIYAFFSTDNFQGFFYTRDNGETWTNCSYPSTVSSIGNVVCGKYLNHMFASSDQGLLLSTSRGNKWDFAGLPIVNSFTDLTLDGYDNVAYISEERIYRESFDPTTSYFLSLKLAKNNAVLIDPTSVEFYDDNGFVFKQAVFDGNQILVANKDYILDSIEGVIHLKQKVKNFIRVNYEYLQNTDDALFCGDLLLEEQPLISEDETQGGTIDLSNKLVFISPITYKNTLENLENLKKQLNKNSKKTLIKAETATFNWKDFTRLGFKITTAAVLVNDDNIYTFGAASTSEKAIYRINIIGNAPNFTITKMASELPFPLQKSIGYASNFNMIYLVGGRTGSNSNPLSNEAVIYSVSSNNVILLERKLLPESIAASCVFYNKQQDNDYLYIIGGVTTSGVSDKIYRLAVDPFTGRFKDGWPEVFQSFEIAISDALPIQYRGYYYLIGGKNDSELNLVYKISVAPDGKLKWKKQKTLPKPLANIGAVIYDDYLYIFGGSSGNTYESSVYAAKLNPMTGSLISDWMYVGQIKDKNCSNYCFIYNKKILLVGGANGSYLVSHSDIIKPYSLVLKKIKNSTVISVNSGMYDHNFLGFNYEIRRQDDDTPIYSNTITAENITYERYQRLLAKREYAQTLIGKRVIKKTDTIGTQSSTIVEVVNGLDRTVNRTAFFSTR